MSELGILESLEARVKALEEKVFAQTACSSEVITGVDVASEPDTSDTGNTNVELDVQGLPWNEEFHAGTKGKNNDGTWKLKRGCDKDAFEAWKTAYLVTEADVGDTQVETEATPQAPAAPEVPATPAAPAVPETPQAPQAPAVPSAPATPKPPKTEPTEQRQALEQINRLTNDFKIDYDLIIRDVLKPAGADKFDALPADAYVTVFNECKAWADYLDLCQDQIDRIDLIETGTNGEHNLMESLVNYHLNTAVKGATTLSQIGRGGLGKLYDALKESADQWVEWYKSVPNGRDVDAELAKG
jgi:hypothetical protein